MEYIVRWCEGGVIMLNKLKCLALKGHIKVNGILRSKKGLGTIEIVVILGILLGIALLFKETVTNFVTDLMEEFFDVEKFK